MPDRTTLFNQRRGGLFLAIALITLLAGWVQAAQQPFFAFDNGVGRDQKWPVDKQAQTLKELGYHFQPLGRVWKQDA